MEMSDFYPPIQDAVIYQTSSETWEHFRPLIVSLYVDQDKTLPEVMRTLAQNHNHFGTMKQYKGRIKKWGLDKNHKEKEMQAIVHQKRQRDAAGKASVFSVRGRKVTAAEVFTYFRRKGILDPESEIVSKDTMPDALRIWTPTPSAGATPGRAEEGDNEENINEQPFSSKNRLTESSNPISSVTMDLASTAGADDHMRTFTINQMRQLLSLSPEMSTLEVPRSPLPPQDLLLPEQLFSTIKVYYQGSIDNETFLTNDRGWLVHISHYPGAGDKHVTFDELCTAALVFISGGAWLEGRRLLSQACVLVREVIEAEDPHTLEYIIYRILNLSQHAPPEFSIHLRNYISEMAAQLLHPEHPWRQILLMIGRVKDLDIQPLLSLALLCTVDSLRVALGEFNMSAFDSYITYLTTYADINTAKRQLPGLLEDAERKFDLLDMRIDTLRYRNGEVLFDQQQYSKAILFLEKVSSSSPFYVQALELLGFAHNRLGHAHESETSISEAIETHRKLYGINNPLRISCMYTLHSFLRGWGRVEESETLRAEISRLTESEGIDSV